MRGEYGRSIKNILSVIGSPPLAWGIQGLHFDPKGSTRITPTCVGNTRCHDGKPRLEEDHPHLRGEYPFFRQKKRGTKGSPPLAWGIPRLDNEID